MEILCPSCPVCGQPPHPVSMPLQAFCGNDDCNVLTWNPTKSAEQNMFDAGYASIDGELPPKVNGG